MQGAELISAHSGYLLYIVANLDPKGYKKITGFIENNRIIAGSQI